MRETTASKRISQTRAQPSVKRLKTRHNAHDDDHVNNNKLSMYIPDDILEKIFTFLPIKESIKIGTLSKRFKNSWLLRSRLNFDQDFTNGCCIDDFVSIVEKVMDLHAGPSIESFSLHLDPRNHGSLVEQWIKKAIYKGVEELDLDFTEAFNLPSGLLDIESLRSLKLCRSFLELPPRMQGLRFLNTLILRHVHVITSNLMDSLYSGCLLLETLDLAHCTGHLKFIAVNLKRLKTLRIGHCKNVTVSGIFSIHIPCLRSLYYCGRVHDLTIGDISQLNDALLNFRRSTDFKDSFQVINLVNDISLVQVLSTTSTFLEGLSPRIIGGTWREMSYCFPNLKEFQLFMEGARFCNPLDIVLFINNCPCLERLLIDFNKFSFECGLCWELHHCQLFEQYRPYPNLKFIKLIGFKFQKYEVMLVKLFLQRAIYLEKLALVSPPQRRSIKRFVSDLAQYNLLFMSWKASIKAQIVGYERSKDWSEINPLHCNTWY